MTTLTYPVNTIMAYVGPDAAVVGVNNNGAMPVWGGSQVFFVRDGASGAGGGVRQFEIDPNGDQTLVASTAALGLASANISALTGGAAVIDSSGTFLYINETTFNLTRIAKIRASDLTLVSEFGTPGNLGNSDSTHVDSSWVLLPRSGDLVCGSQFSTELMNSITLPSFSLNTVLGNLISGGKTFGQYGGYSASTTSYWIGEKFNQTLGLVLNSISGAGSIAVIGTITPANVDAAWTNITGSGGLLLDQTDGHLIAAMQTTDSVTHKNYIVKINSGTAAIMWALAVTDVTPLVSYPYGMTFGRCQNQVFHYLDGATVRHINTSAGSQTTTVFTGITGFGPQYSDDVTNSIITYATFAAGSPQPNYVGTVMGTNGNHNLTAWMRLWTATAGPVPGGSGRRGMSEMGPVRH